jgi:hypothetical protein
VFWLIRGDDVEIRMVDKREFGVWGKPGREELLKRIRAFADAFRPASSPIGKRPMPGSFFDTTVFLYGASGARTKAARLNSSAGVAAWHNQRTTSQSQQRHRPCSGLNVTCDLRI